MALLSAKVALVVIAVATTPLAAAPPTLNYLFPAGAQLGTSVQVAAGGSFERWPVNVWVSGKGISAKASPTKGTLTVTVAGDAAPGTRWLRVFDDQGASSLRPFIVGTLAEKPESEPNDGTTKPQPASLDMTINGRLQKAGDVDCFAVSLRRGQVISASVEAHQTLRSALDATLQVVSSRGFVLEHNDDAVGLDPRLTFTAPADGTYVVRLFGFPATPDSSIRYFGSDASIYRLTITNGGFPDESTAIPIAPVQAPFEISGRISSPNAPTTVLLQAAKGKAVVIQANVTEMGSALTPVLRVLDDSKRQLARSEPSTIHTNGVLHFTPAQDGVVRIEISDIANDGSIWHRYHLRVALTEPDFELTVAAEQFQVVPGKPLDLPVSIARRHGITGEIELAAEGLPPGLTAVQMGQRDGTKAMLRLTADKAGATGPFRITGRPKGQPNLIRFATAVLAGFDAATSDLWITSTASPAVPTKPAKK